MFVGRANLEYDHLLRMKTSLHLDQFNCTFKVNGRPVQGVQNLSFEAEVNNIPRLTVDILPSFLSIARRDADKTSPLVITIDGKDVKIIYNDVQLGNISYIKVLAEPSKTSIVMRGRIPMDFPSWIDYKATDNLLVDFMIAAGKDILHKKFGPELLAELNIKLAEFLDKNRVDDPAEVCVNEAEKTIYARWI
jgi:hypothetical protein